LASDYIWADHISARDQINVPHHTGVVHLSAPLAPCNFLPQVGQPCQFDLAQGRMDRAVQDWIIGAFLCATVPRATWSGSLYRRLRLIAT
jgi:hypothetical protein